MSAEGGGFWEVNFPDVIEAAARSPLGVLSLCCLALGLLAFSFFRHASEAARLSVFVLLLVSVLGSAGAVYIQSERALRSTSDPARVSANATATSELETKTHPEVQPKAAAKKPMDILVFECDIPPDLLRKLLTDLTPADDANTLTIEKPGFIDSELSYVLYFHNEDEAVARMLNMQIQNYVTTEPPELAGESGNPLGRFFLYLKGQNCPRRIQDD